MGYIARTLSWPLRAVATWTGEYPFRAVGLVVALGGILATLVTVGALTPTGLVADALTAAALTAFATSHPAYPAAVVVGVGLLVRP